MSDSIKLYLANYNEIQTFEVVYTNKKYHFIDREKVNHELYAIALDDMNNEKKFDGYGWFDSEEKAYRALIKFSKERVTVCEKQVADLNKAYPQFNEDSAK